MRITTQLRSVLYEEVYTAYDRVIGCMLPVLCKITKGTVWQKLECMHCTGVYHELHTTNQVVLFDNCSIEMRTTCCINSNRVILYDMCTIGICTTSCAQYNRVTVYDNCTIEMCSTSCVQSGNYVWQLLYSNVYHKLCTIQQGNVVWQLCNSNVYYKLCTIQSGSFVWQCYDRNVYYQLRTMHPVCTTQWLLFCTGVYYQLHTDNQPVLYDGCTIEMHTTSCVQYNEVVIYNGWCVVRVRTTYI